MKDNIEFFPGYYISKDGVLYSRYRGGYLKDKYSPMKLYKRSNGYVQAVLKVRKLGLIRRVYIHRLVAETYIPNPDNKPCVCHKDNNRSNNSVNNLYWGTYKENTTQALVGGRLSRNKKLRALIFSDLHLGNYSKFSTRLNTGLAVLDILSDLAEKYQVPVFHCGDFFHTPEKMDQALLEAVINKFEELELKDWVLYTISGNHTICRVSKVGIKPISWDSIFSDHWGFFRCIDYDRVHVKNMYFHGIPYIDHNLGLGEYLKNLRLPNKGRSKHILLLHSDYPGARDTDNSETRSSENISQNMLEKFDLTLMGHIHKPQRLGKKVYMIGAPYQQRRTDKGCDLGYWELYSDLSMVFVPLSDKFPRFIDVSSPEEVKEDGNYYTVISSKVLSMDAVTNPISKKLSKKRMVKRYLKAKNITDKKKESILLDIIKESEDD